MAAKSKPDYWQAWWESLTKPDASITSVDERQQARLLAAMLLTLLLLAAAIAPLWILSSSDFTLAPYLTISAIAFFALVYAFSRTRFYYTGAVLLVLYMPALVVTTILTGPGPLPMRMLALKALIVAVMISILFLRRRFTLLLIGACLSIIFIFFFLPDVPFPFAYSYLVFFLVITGLAAVTAALGQQYKRELAASEAQYRSLVTALSEGVILQSQDGTIQASNPVAEQILGLTAEQISGRISSELRWRTIHEDGSPFPEEDYPVTVTLRTGQPLKNVVMGVYKPVGDLRWLSINSQPLIRPDESQPYAVVASFADITAFKQQEIALRNAQHRYRALFEQSHDAVFILDLDGRHIEANRRAAEMLGYTLAEMQELSAEQITAEPVKSEKMFERLLAGEHLPIYERYFRRKDGSLMPVELKAELVRDVKGNPLHIQSIVRDITERKAWEQRLRLQSAALEAAANAIIITDSDGLIQWSNSAYTRLTGYTAEEAYGKNPRELVKSGFHDEAFYKKLWETILAGQIWHGKVINRRKDNRRYIEEQTITPVTDQDGTITHFVAVKEDITEREKAAQALRRSETRLRALLKAIPDLMFRNYRDGTFLDYHAGDESKLALPPEEFLGRKSTEVLPPELTRHHLYYIEQALRTGHQVLYEYSLSRSGQSRHFEARMVPSGPDEVLSIVRDVTEEKKWQAQALELALEKERVNVLRQFVQNASHELRTPLTVINTDLYLLTRVKDEQKRQFYIERSQQQIIRLTHLLEMMLSMTKLDSDIPFDFVGVEINGMVEQLVSGAARVFSEKGGSIQFIPDPALPRIAVDETWLQEAIRHLLDNGIRFTPKGGWLRLRIYSQNGQIVIEINDSGIGISEQALPRIFERFWRQDEAHTTPGFGLGLSIAQEIVRRHNGRIEVESKVGQGSRFQILLPNHAHPDS
jgi:PAS domain S-box-containing protein